MAWNAEDSPDPDIIGMMNRDFERQTWSMVQRYTARDIGWIFPSMRLHEQMAREADLDELANRIHGTRSTLGDHCEWGFGHAQSRSLGGFEMAGRFGVMVIRFDGFEHLGYELTVYRPDGDELKTSHEECDTAPNFMDLYRKGIEAINNKKGTNNGS